MATKSMNLHWCIMPDENKELCMENNGFCIYVEQWNLYETRTMYTHDKSKNICHVRFVQLILLSQERSQTFQKHYTFFKSNSYHRSGCCFVIVFGGDGLLWWQGHLICTVFWFVEYFKIYEHEFSLQILLGVLLFVRMIDNIQFNFSGPTDTNIRTVPPSK